MAKKMITVRNYDALHDTVLDVDQLYLYDASKTLAAYIDTSSLQELVITGKNFRFEHGLVTKGTITSLTLVNDDGERMQRMTGPNIDATQIGGSDGYEYMQALSVRVALSSMKLIGTSEDDTLTTQKRNDILLGMGGDDTLNGGRGNDRMTGGAGFDTFVFSAGFGRDVITDFDADGGVGAQDHIDATYPGSAYVKASGKHDTVIDFGNGDRLKLLNVDPDQIDASDFV